MSIAVKNFLHVGPPFSGSAGLEGLLARFADIPPLLRLRIGRHAGHVCGEILTMVFKVGKEKSVFVINGVVADAALPDFGQHAGPDGGVELLVFFVFLRTETDD